MFPFKINCSSVYIELALALETCCNVEQTSGREGVSKQKSGETTEHATYRSGLFINREYTSKCLSNRKASTIAVCLHGSPVSIQTLRSLWQHQVDATTIHEPVPLHSHRR